ncbi:hypothetical protein KY285_012757 [Solanum tuberosum]|nr:hypothetical protein KY285_012757 [Solanum tuberosum]
MTAPPSLEEGQSTTRPPRFNNNTMDSERYGCTITSWQKTLSCGMYYLMDPHEGTTQVKESKVDMLTTQYENFSIKEGETIHEMNTRFTSIINELRCLGEPIHPSKQVQKILRAHLKSWENKMSAIIEARDLKEEKKEKSVALKIYQNDGSEDEDEMTYMTRRF